VVGEPGTGKGTGTGPGPGRGWLVFPVPGRVLSFDGGLLHGVLPEPPPPLTSRRRREEQKGVTVEEKEVDEEEEEEEEDAAGAEDARKEEEHGEGEGVEEDGTLRPPQRLTLMIGWHGPASAPPPLSAGEPQVLGPLMEAPDPIAAAVAAEAGGGCSADVPEWARVDLRPQVGESGFWSGSDGAREGGSSGGRDMGGGDAGGMRVRSGTPGSGFLGPFSPVWEPVQPRSGGGGGAFPSFPSFAPPALHLPPPLGLRYFLTHEEQLADLYIRGGAPCDD
jgi:hypothetical protein